jgi:hypothetical protein
MPVEARAAPAKGRLIARKMPILRNEAVADYQRLNPSRNARNACCGSGFSLAPMGGAKQSACHGI